MQDSEGIRVAPRAQAPGLGLGERLRSARKARAISVAQAAEALRLEEPSLIALEEERFDVLGAPVFVRGHLRRYAELVGLSPDAVLDAYRASVPSSDELPKLVRPREQQADALSVGPWLYWVGAVLVVLAIGFVLWRGSGEPPPGAATPAMPAAVPPAPPAQPPLPQPPPVQPPPAAPPPPGT